MKVLALRCAQGHGFEGWFDSQDDFLTQNGDRRIACPLCNDSVIVQTPSAPRLNLGAREPKPAPATVDDALARGRDELAMPDSMQVQWLQAVRHVMANTEDVGSKFADEARRIHYGEVEPRGIRGQATASERDALQDEGIAVTALPVPEALKGPLQ